MTILDYKKDWSKEGGKNIGFDEQNTEDAAGKPNPNKNKNGETGAKVGSALNAAAKIVGQFTQKQDWSKLNR